MSGFGQLLRFAAVAAINLGINLGVLAVGVRVLGLPARFGNVGLLTAQAAAVLAATSAGYVLHAKFTFTNARRAEGLGRVGRFWSVAGAALLVQVPLFAALVRALRAVVDSALIPYAANVLGGVVIFVGSFLLNRIWTFQANPES